MPKIIENIREILLENGRQMLLEENYSEFNLRNLTRKCGVGLGTFYNYFSSKEDLVYSIFMNDWEKTLGLLEDLKFRNISFKEKIFLLNKSLEKFLGQYLKVFREIASQNNRSCPADYYDKIGNSLEELVEYERKSGNLNTKVTSDKLARFILVNLFDRIKNEYMSFDELFECMNF